jgi:predicted KAP-like P-loop ATPase
MVDVWSDEPIASKDEDVLDRAPYAIQAARLITVSDPSKSSIVFGLTGAWGSGKSSMLAMIQEEIEESYPAWRVARSPHGRPAICTGCSAISTPR